MKILLSSSCDDSFRGNPYVLNLMQALKLNGEAQVEYGLHWLWDPRFSFNLIHFQWPEEIFGWRAATEAELARLQQRLEEHKNGGGKCVITVHNELPHGQYAKPFEALYRLLYEYADALVHLGEASISSIKARYFAETNSKIHRVIKHGDYGCFLNGKEKGEARKCLKLSEEEFVLVHVGAIRSEKELGLLLRGFRVLPMQKKRLLIAGRLPYPSRRDWRHYWLRLRLQRDAHVLLVEKNLTNDEVERCVVASDMLFIARTESLNSGNVALAYTFGKVVVGPDIAVIGEDLRAAGNYTFDPRSVASIDQAIVASLKQTDQGDKNKQWASEHMHWQTIASDCMVLYQEVWHA
ncbi:hypothetical protein [Rubritalea sp.]|uniref:hypothetical protein n=1 Tax=Rubritalea sp. TaxID=2109375 RepID=UPI003EF231B8